MSVIFILIPIALILALGFLSAFFWATKDGQFDDSYSPSIRILFDSNKPNKNHSED